MQPGPKAAWGRACKDLVGCQSDLCGISSRWGLLFPRRAGRAQGTQCAGTGAGPPKDVCHVQSPGRPGGQQGGPAAAAGAVAGVVDEAGVAGVVAEVLLLEGRCRGGVLGAVTVLGCWEVLSQARGCVRPHGTSMCSCQGVTPTAWSSAPHPACALSNVAPTQQAWLNSMLSGRRQHPWEPPAEKPFADVQGRPNGAAEMVTHAESEMLKGGRACLGAQVGSHKEERAQGCRMMGQVWHRHRQGWRAQEGTAGRPACTCQLMTVDGQ